jgi:putative transposase
VKSPEGIKPLLEEIRELFPRLSHLWLDAGYRGEEKGRGWVEKVLGWTVDLLVERPRKSALEEVLKLWAAEWAKEAEKVDWQKLMPPRGFQVLPRRRVVERAFSWIDHNRRTRKDYERLTDTSEAFMVRRLAYTRGFSDSLPRHSGGYRIIEA